MLTIRRTKPTFNTPFYPYGSEFEMNNQNNINPIEAKYGIGYAMCKKCGDIVIVQVEDESIDTPRGRKIEFGEGTDHICPVTGMEITQDQYTTPIFPEDIDWPSSYEYAVLSQEIYHKRIELLILESEHFKIGQEDVGKMDMED